MGKVKYYYTSVSSSQEIKKNQQKIEMTLTGLKIDFEKIDISANPDDKAKMREIAGDEKALPPQLANDDVYCGDYAAFAEAVEDTDLDSFLKLK